MKRYEMPIEPELDLHAFRPEDLGEFGSDYLEACRAKEFWRCVSSTERIGN